MLQNDGLTLFPPETANHWTSVTPPRLLALGAREKGQEDHAGSLRHPPLLGDDPLALIARTGSSAVSAVQISSAPRSLC